MGDTILFALDVKNIRELEGQSAEVEKYFQNLREQHLETFLGVRYLTSEYSTGKTNGGRIDTLGIDGNGYLVVIKYKRAVNELCTE